MSLELVADLGSLAKIIIAIHTNNDAFGNRFTPEQRRVLYRTKAHLEQQLAVKYARGNLLGLNDYLARHSFGLQEVKVELAERAGG